MTRTRSLAAAEKSRRTAPRTVENMRPPALSPVALSAREILQLQRTAGNAAVCQLLSAQRPAVHRQEGPITVQRGFFGKLWKGIKKAAHAVGSAFSGAAKWAAARFGDAAEWVINLFRDLPGRLLRLGKTIADGLIGVATFIPGAIGALIHGGIKGFAHWFWEEAKAGGAWVLTLASRLFDLGGGPELAEFVEHLFSASSPLTGSEKEAAQSVLGPNAIRWDEVRIDEGGVLGLVFKLNHDRAFTTFHTINMSPKNRANMSIVVHELTHVDQYEHAGSVYIGQALGDQISEGDHAYDYGGTAGLEADVKAGKHYAELGRERQAQVAQDYYTDRQNGGDTTPYEPFIAELRKGEL